MGLQATKSISMTGESMRRTLLQQGAIGVLLGLALSGKALPYVPASAPPFTTEAAQGVLTAACGSEALVVAVRRGNELLLQIVLPTPQPVL